MKLKYAILALGLLCLAPGAWAQSAGGAGGKGAAAVDPPAKVAVLNVQAAIANTAEGKQAASELQAQFAPRRNELESLSKKIDELQSRLRSGERTLSDEEKDRLAREGEQLTKQFQRKQQEVQDDANDARNEVVNRIGRKMMEVLDRYARDSAYSVVLDTSSQTTPVVFASNGVDITQEVIRLYDQAYPVKNAGGTKPGTQAPAQSKPPATAPKPPATTPPATKPPKP